MKQVNLLVFASLCCLVSSAPQVYYVTPTKPDPQGSCHVDGTTLRPCYTLQKLNGVLSSSNGSIEVLLLPGTHLIPEKETLNVSQFSEVVICPWKEEPEIIIECEYHKDQTSIWFHNIIELQIFSLRFSTCKLQYGYDMNSTTERSVNITKSVFEKSSVDIRSNESNLNVTVSNCTYSFSALSMLTPDFTRGTAHVRHIAIANLQITDTLFRDNTNLQVVYTNLTINNCCFINNFVSNNGGTIVAVSSFLKLKSTTFLHSVYYAMGVLGSVLQLSHSNGTIDACLFFNISADRGNTVYIEDSPLSISNSTFEENSGAIDINSGTLKVIISNCTFRNNSGNKGGALHVVHSNNVNICNSSFIFNKAVLGGAIYCVNSVIAESQIYSFSNSAKNGGYAYYIFSNTYVDNYDYSYNQASNGGAIYARLWSHLNFITNTTISNNIAYKNGGAFYLDNSRIHVDSDPLILSNNVAKQKGGAIFVPDTNCANGTCFMHNDKGYIFMNNTAPQGPVLYGGLLDRCYFYDKLGGRKLGIDVLKSNSKYKHTPEAITSDPVRICLCTENHELDCTTRNLTVSDKYIGQIINLLGTVVDQDNKPKVSYIRAGYNEITAGLGKGEGRRETGKNCSKLNYHIFTRYHSATLVLQPESSCASSNFSSITVHIEVKSCPRGFEQNDDQCECDKRLSNHFKGIVCDINTDTITTKESTTWIGYDENYLKVQANCPLDNCEATSDNISLENPDEQCANNRSGVTCGSCQEDYSIGLGGSKCLQCTSNSPLMWLIPVFAVAGVALVALLLVCNMTISHGTLNGLIFYAYVVSITRLTSLQSCSIHPILSVFIAWVNLDFGVETCFYSGMDTYQKTWLQLLSLSTSGYW